MRRAALLAISVGLALSCLTRGDEPAAEPPKQPTTQPKAPVADYVRELINDYVQGEERERFFDAAGVDGELSQEEFAGAAGKPKSLVRPGDRWESALGHDKDAGRSLNWDEWEQYRLAVRREYLARFDRNGDGKLTADELTGAGAATRPGQPASPPAGDFLQRYNLLRWDANKDGRLDEAETAAMERERGNAQKQIEQAQQRYRDMVAKYDKDGDGKLSPEETKAWAEELRAEQQKQMLEKWDADGDGQIDEDERKAMYEGYRKQAEEARRQWLIRRHDKDGDGVLNDQERAAMEAEQEKQRQAMEALQQRQREWIKPWDTDGDGQLSASEQKVMLERIRSEWDQRRKQMDADGDGKVSAEETRAYWDKLREKYDANGNGVFDADEYRKMIEQEGRGLWQGPQPVVVPGGSGGTAGTSEGAPVIVNVARPPTTQP